MNSVALTDQDAIQPRERTRFAPARFAFLVVPAARRALFLGLCAFPAGADFAGTPIFAALRTTGFSVADGEEESSPNPWLRSSCVRLVTVPAARPSLRATALSRGSCLTGAFFADIELLAISFFIVGDISWAIEDKN